MSTTSSNYQSVYASSLPALLAVGDSFELPVYYEASDPQLTGLTLNIHFDSSLLGLLFYESKVADLFGTPVLLNDSDDLDGDEKTDRILQFNWVSFAGSFPNITLPAEIARVKFELLDSVYLENPPQSTNIRFTGEASSGYIFSGKDELIALDYNTSLVDTGLGSIGSITSSSAGVFQEGVTLTAPLVTGDPDGDALNPNYAYQWFKGSTAITNATASTYAIPASGTGTYKVAVTYTDAQGFIATVDSPDQVVSKPTLQQVDIAPSQSGSRFSVENVAAPEVIVNLKGSSDLIEINAEVSATLNAVTTENWGTGYVAWNVGSTIQVGTGERVSLNGLGKYSFVATAINEATSTIVLEQDKNSAFFLHDAYSAFYEGLTLSTDSTGRQSAARILDFDVIKMGSAGGNSIVDLTSKDYITGAVTVHGADKGRSIFWGTDSDDTFLSGGGDSVIFGGGGFNHSKLGAGKDVLQFRSTVDSTNLIRGFDPTKDVLELWRGRTETVEAPTFITEGNSTTMTWGINTVQFEGLTGITAESLLISTQFAV